MADLSSFHSIDELINEEREETLHLEFKTLSSDSTLTRDDRKLIAKAISGFANAEGGTLIIGIETKKADGVDVASGKKLVKNLARMRRLISAALPELLSPQHTGVTLVALEDAAPTEGFLIVKVDSSNDRPHMSVPDRRYFRRGSDGTRVLDHGEIRELMFAAREAVLSIDWTLRLGVSSGAHKFALYLTLALRNEGRIPAVAPYVRLRAGRPRFSSSPVLNLNARQAADHTYGFYCSRDVIVHLQDEIWIAECATGLDLSRTGHHHLPTAVALAMEHNMQHTYKMGPWDSMHGDQQSKDQPIEVGGWFGAENAQTKEFHFQIDKRSLLEKFCQVKDIPVERKVSP